jgi:hypothetical protein
VSDDSPHAHHHNGPKSMEKAAESVYLRLVSRYAMAASLPLTGFVLTMMFKAQESAIRQEERLISLTDRLDRQINGLSTILNSRIDAQASRIQQLDTEVNRLRDSFYARPRTTPP